MELSEWQQEYIRHKVTNILIDWKITQDTLLELSLYNQLLEHSWNYHLVNKNTSGA